MNSTSWVRVSSSSSALAKPTASKPIASARSRMASRIGSAISVPSTPSPIGSDAGVGEPQPGGRLAGLVEYVDRDAAARVPIAADPQPLRLHSVDQTARHHQGAVFVEGAMIAKRAQKELQRLAFED